MLAPCCCCCCFPLGKISSLAQPASGAPGRRQPPTLPPARRNNRPSDLCSWVRSLTYARTRALFNENNRTRRNPLDCITPPSLDGFANDWPFFPHAVFFNVNVAKTHSRAPFSNKRPSSNKRPPPPVHFDNGGNGNGRSHRRPRPLASRPVFEQTPFSASPF